MNKIIIDEENIESNFELIIKDNKIYLNVDECFITYNNTKRNIDFVISSSCKINEYLFKSDVTISYELEANLELYSFKNDSSNKTKINLNKENISIIYITSGLSFLDNFSKIDIYHNKNKTNSKVVTHIINMLDNSYEIEVNSHLFSNAFDIENIQDSKIILMKNGKALIKPNLLVYHNLILAEHSSYIGSFKKDDLFYLMTRGLSYNDANRILTKAFLIDKMNIDYEFS